MAQVLMSKVSEIGMFRLIPRILALMAVQRQTAASRSTRPSSREQQGVPSGGEPITVPSKAPWSTLAHTPSFRASLGQLIFIGFVFGIKGFV